MNINHVKLGNEPGYRRLNNNELIQEGDETFGVLGGSRWTRCNSAQIGYPAYSVGGYFIWRRPVVDYCEKTNN